MLINQSNKLAEGIKSYGFDATAVGIGNYKEVETGVTVSGEETLYKASVALVKVIAGI